MLVPVIVSRSQTASGILPGGGGFPGGGPTLELGEGEFKTGELLTSLSSAIPNESTGFKTFKRTAQDLAIRFTPSQLRTSYVIDDLVISFPRTFAKVNTTEATFSTTNLEVGWGVALLISGLPYLSELIPVKQGEFTGGVVMEFFESEWLPFTKQIQLTQSIKVAPGASVELKIFTFFRTEGKITNPKVKSFQLTSSISGEIPPKLISCTMIYEQEFYK